MLFLVYPVEPTACCAAHSKYCRKREHQCRKLKPSRSHNAYLLHFLEGHLSCLAQESRMFRKHVKLMQVQLLNMFLNEKVGYSCDWLSVLSIKLYIHTRCFSNCLSNVINYIWFINLILNIMHFFSKIVALNKHALVLDAPSCGLRREDKSFFSPPN